MCSDLSRRLDGLFKPGQRVICATSGGADSIALLTCLWMARERLGIDLAAAHFNHRLRGAESDGDEAFVRDFCLERGIPLYAGGGDVAGRARQTGESVEQAARALRYAFLNSLPCDWIVTAHTADDNAETLLMNLLRGTGLRGLCGIPPRRGKILRPFLTTTREEIQAFLTHRKIPHVEDATNALDGALRNRIRHRLLPLCKEENPDFLRDVAQMTQILRRDEALLARQTADGLETCRKRDGYSVRALRAMPDALRARALRQLLTYWNVSKPTRRHVAGLERLVWSENPSARVNLPGGVVAAREYDVLRRQEGDQPAFAPVRLNPNGVTYLPECGLEIFCRPAGKIVNTPSHFCVVPHGPVTVRPRRPGDVITLSGGEKTLKKLMIDRKIPRYLRPSLPVLADRDGVLAVYSIGANLARMDGGDALSIEICQINL